MIPLHAIHMPYKPLSGDWSLPESLPLKSTAFSNGNYVLPYEQLWKDNLNFIFMQEDMSTDDWLAHVVHTSFRMLLLNLLVKMELSIEEEAMT